MRLHASCVAIGGRGVLLLGRSGSGKSDLALRLLDRGACLVSDDGVELVARDGRLEARSPATIAGLLEVRGLGIVTLEALPAAPIALAVALDRPVPRMPDDPLPVETIEQVAVPLVLLAAFEASAPIKVERALGRWGLPA